MKIAFIGQKGIPSKFGGIETHVEELTTKLVGLGFDVTVYTRPWYTDKNLREYKGVKLHSLPCINSKHLDAISHTFLASLHAAFSNCDIIHYHGVGPALLSFLPKLFFCKAKIVVTFHCIDRQHAKWGYFAKKILQLGEFAANCFADKTITVSKTLQAYCKMTYKNDAVYIPNGINAPVKQAVDLIRQKFNLEKNSYILMVSRLVKHKGAHYLIDAYKQLNTNLKLVIVGDSAFTDDYVLNLRAQAKDNPNIIFTGYQNGRVLQELFTNAYLAVLPSESEGLSIAVLEALSYEKCMLVSDIAPNLEAIEKYGFSFKNKNVADLKDKLQYLLNNPQIVQETGEKAYQYVLRQYNWQDISQQISALYKTLKYQEFTLPMTKEETKEHKVTA